jgi:hypothetical protein
MQNSSRWKDRSKGQGRSWLVLRDWLGVSGRSGLRQSCLKLETGSLRRQRVWSTSHSKFTMLQVDYGLHLFNCSMQEVPLMRTLKLPTRHSLNHYMRFQNLEKFGVKELVFICRGTLTIGITIWIKLENILSLQFNSHHSMVTHFWNS